MFRYLLRSALLAAVACACVPIVPFHAACASWKLIAQLNQGQGHVIYFFDSKIGFLGFGITTMPIWKTTDGGTTWAAATTPRNPGGYVTDIWFSTKSDGWATISRGNSGGNGDLWHSSDTGNTWTRCLGFSFSDPSSVRRTPTALCVSGSGFGVVYSTDSAASFMQSFLEPMRGLDLVDNLHLACTPLSSPTYYYSSDGGTSWLPSNDLVGDAWGIRGVKGTPTYFVAPEDQLHIALTSNVYRSNDYGATWNLICPLPFKTTGDIKGTGCGMYIQNSDKITGEPLGLYRSTDQGITWTNIGGPTNTFDTRFEVVGAGQTIFAFDESGGLWETTDGGDGFTGSGALALVLDTSAIDFGSGNACQTHDTEIVCANAGCLPLTINTWSMSQNGTGFNLDTIGHPFPISLEPGQSDSLHIFYTSGSGHLFDTVILSSSDDSGRVRRIPVEINILGNGSRTLALDTTPVDLGSGNACTIHDTTIRFTDSGCSPLIVTGWKMSEWGTGFTVFGTGQPPPITLAPGQTDSLQIRYASGIGQLFDTVILTSEADNGLVRRIPVEATITPIDSVQFAIALSPDPVRPEDTLTVTISPDRTVQGNGLQSIQGSVEYHLDSYDFISAHGAPGAAQLQLTHPFILGQTAHLDFLISSAADIFLDPATPILTVLLRARLTDTSVSRFLLDSLLLNGDDPNYGNCVLAASTAGAVSHLDLACGDSVLILEMRNRLVLGFENPKHNPLTKENDYRSSFVLHSTMDGIAKVTITDMLGRSVVQSTLGVVAGEPTLCTFDLSHQPAGTYFYFLNLSTRNGIAIRNGSIMVVR